MKKIVALTIILASMITFVSNFSFAETPTLTTEQLADIETAYCAQSPICGTAPQQFTFLMDFVREMTNSMKTVGTAGEYLGDYVTPNWFKGNLFVPQKKPILGRLANNLLQKGKLLLAIAAIFGNPVNVAGLKDMVGGVVLLVKNKVFLRDNKIIEELESLVNDKKYELGMGGGYAEQIIPENRVVMQAIIDKYKDKGLLTEGSIIKDGTTYSNVTSLLTQALSSAKSFLYFGATSQFDSMSRGFSDGISIGFVPAAIKGMQRDYQCARGPNAVCSSEGKKIIIWLKNLKNISIGSTETTKVYKDAYTRLLETLYIKKKSDAFKKREADILNSAYGTRPKGLFGGSIKESLKKIKDQAVDFASDVSTFRTFPKNLKGVQESLPKKLDIPPPNAFDTTTINHQIDVYVYDVLNNQQNDLNLVSMSEVIAVTPAFKILGNQIATIKDKILGGKDKKNSLISSLGAACELQCGRWGLCR